MYKEKYDEQKMIGFIKRDISRLIIIKQRLLEVLIDLEEGRIQEIATPLLKSIGKKAQMYCLEMICTRIKILNLNQNNTYVTSDDDIKLLEMIYIDMFDDIRSVIDNSNVMHINEKHMIDIFKSKIGRDKYVKALSYDWWSYNNDLETTWFRL